MIQNFALASIEQVQLTQLVYIGSRLCWFKLSIVMGPNCGCSPCHKVETSYGEMNALLPGLKSMRITDVADGSSSVSAESSKAQPRPSARCKKMPPSGHAISWSTGKTSFW